MTRVVGFAWFYKPFVGGAEIAFENTLSRMEDYEFIIITARIKKDLSPVEKQGNITIIRVGHGHWTDKWLYHFRAVRKATQLHHEKPFEIAHALMVGPAAIVARKFKKKTGVPSVISLQSGNTEERLKRWLGPYRLLYSKLYTYADKVHAISNYLANRAKSNGVSTDKITVIPNGVDVNTFSKKVSSSRVKVIRKEQDIPLKAPVVITTSRLSHKNGVDLLCRAMEHLKDWHLLILGGGEKEEDYKQIAAGVSDDRIHFLGTIDYEDIPEYLAASNVFCRPSRTEGFGNSFIEALTAGLPIVGTKVGGIPDFLEDSVNGVYCKLEPESIAQSIGKAKDIKPEFNAEKYSWDNISNEISMFYSDVEKKT